MRWTVLGFLGGCSVAAGAAAGMRWCWHGLVLWTRRLEGCWLLLGLCLAGLRVWCGGMEVWLSPSGGAMHREAGRLVLRLAGRALRVEFCIGKWGGWGGATECLTEYCPLCPSGGVLYWKTRWPGLRPAVPSRWGYVSQSEPVGAAVELFCKRS